MTPEQIERRRAEAVKRMRRLRSKRRRRLDRWRAYPHVCPKCGRLLFKSMMDRTVKVCVPLSDADRRARSCPGFERRFQA